MVYTSPKQMSELLPDKLYTKTIPSPHRQASHMHIVSDFLTSTTLLTSSAHSHHELKAKQRDWKERQHFIKEESKHSSSCLLSGHQTSSHNSYCKHCNI